MSSESRMSRRQLLRKAAALGAGLAFAAPVLAACGPTPTPQIVEKVVKETVVVKAEVTKVVEKEVTKIVAGTPVTVKETVMVEKPVTKEVVKEVVKEVTPVTKVKTVRILVSAWAVEEVPFDLNARKFMDANPGIEIKIESTAAGWDAKVLGQIKAGKVEWSGLNILTPFLVMTQWVESGMIQPMDPYIKTSKEKGAAELLTDMIPTVREDASYKGHFYCIPYSFENITFNWRVDLFGKVGWNKRPEIWDDWYKICASLKANKEIADQKIYPTSFVGALWTDVGALICSASKKPYTEEGLLDWESDAGTQSLEFYRKLVWEDMTPPHGFDDWWPAFQKGKVASVQAQSSRGVWGQKIFGEANMATSPIATKEKGGGAGSVFWGNGSAVITGAPYSQEVTDYYIFTMGPANVAFQKAVIQSGKTPVYGSAYKNIIEADPLFATYKWMMGMREDVARSIPPPRNTFYTIQNTFYRKWIVDYSEKGSKMTTKEFVAKLLKDVRDEIAKAVIK